MTVTPYDCNRGQRPRDARIAPARTYAAQNQQAQNEVLDEVSALADDVMNFKKGGHRRVWHHPMKNWNDDSARIL